MDIFWVIYIQKVFLMKNQFVCCKNLHNVGSNPDDDEFVEVFKFNVYEVEQMIKNGKITDAKSICAFYRYKLYTQSS